MILFTRPIFDSILKLTSLIFVQIVLNGLYCQLNDDWTLRGYWKGYGTQEIVGYVGETIEKGRLDAGKMKC